MAFTLLKLVDTKAYDCFGEPQEYTFYDDDYFVDEYVVEYSQLKHKLQGCAIGRVFIKRPVGQSEKRLLVLM